MVEDKLKELTTALQSCEACLAYRDACERVEENASTVALLKEYHRTQIQVQALVMQNITEGPEFERFRGLSEVLQTDRDATDYLMAEYRLKKQMGDIFKALTHAVGLDLGFLE